LNEAKILIVGETTVGKTSLMKILMNEQMDILWLRYRNLHQKIFIKTDFIEEAKTL
jgi:GTPase SAR1 family protein